MIELFSDLHPIVLGLFSLLCIGLVLVVAWCIAVDNAQVSAGYDEHSRESNWGKP